MKTIVVIAYYHLLHAIEMALTMENKPALVLCTDYTKMEDSLVDKISDSGVFSTVIKTDTRDFLDSFLIELKKTNKMEESELRAIGTSLFDDYIDGYYYPKFEGLDFEDDVYIYSDFHLILYSINKHFKRIVMCEDGYKVISKRYETYQLRGYFKNIERFIDIGAYPKMRYGCEKITSIVCSGDEEGLPPTLREKVSIWDFKQAVSENSEQYGEAVRRIFSIDDIAIRDGAVLLVEQPLYRTHFCNDRNYYLFYKRLLSRLSKDHQVIIKPHPAGTKSMEVFEDDNVTALPKWIPAECLNYIDTVFDDVVTFNSAALDLISNKKHTTALYDSEETSTEKLKAFIQDYIAGEVVDIGLFIYYQKITSGVVKELSRFFVREKRFRYHPSIIVKKGEEAKAVEIAKKLEKNYHEPVRVFSAEIMEDDLFMETMVGHHENYDYSITVSGENKADNIKKAVKLFAKGSLAHCIGAHQLTASKLIVCNPLGDHILTGIINVMWSRNILRRFHDEDIRTSLEAVEYVYDNKISTDSLNRELMVPAENSIDTVRQFAEQCDNSGLADIYHAYNLVLKRVFESKRNKVDVFKDDFFQDDCRTEDKDLFLRVQMAALIEERKLRAANYNRVNKLEDSGSISLVLKWIDFKKRFKRTVKDTIKKMKKMLHLRR